MIRYRIGGLALAALVLIGCAGTTIEQVIDPIFSGESGECRTRLKGLDRAAQIYATDYDDQFPLANWNETIEPYFFGHPEFISCPGLHSDDFSESGYAFNQALVGASIVNHPDPSLLITFFESSGVDPGLTGDPNDFLPTSRHNETIFRVYATGYVENMGGPQ